MDSLQTEPGQDAPSPEAFFASEEGGMSFVQQPSEPGAEASGSHVQQQDDEAQQHSTSPDATQQANSSYQQVPVTPADFLLKAAARQGHRIDSNPEQQRKLLAKLSHLHINGLQLQQLHSLKLCPRLQVLYLYDNQLTSIASLASSRLITHLYVQNNQLQSLEGLQELGLLQKLYLQGNCLQAIDHLNSAVRLEELHCADQHPQTWQQQQRQGQREEDQQQQQHHQQQQQLQEGQQGQQQQQQGEEAKHQQEQQQNQTQPAGQEASHPSSYTLPDTAVPSSSSPVVAAVPAAATGETGGLHFEPASLQAMAGSLRVLSAANCGIQDPAPLAQLYNLRTLDLSNNSISRLDALQPVLHALQHLHELDLRHNPCVLSELKYRDYVILLAADSLATLDGEAVPAAHRAFLLGLHLKKLKAQMKAEQQQGGKGQKQQQQQHKQQQGQLHGGQQHLQQRGTHIEPTAVAAAAAQYQSLACRLAGAAEQSSAPGSGPSVGLAGTGIKLHPLRAPAVRPTAAGGFNVTAVRIGAALAGPQHQGGAGAGAGAGQHASTECWFAEEGCSVDK